MLRRLVSLALAVLLVATMATAAASSVVSYRYVKTASLGSLNLREESNANSRILTTIPYGAKVKLLDYFVGSTWGNVEYKGHYGYVYMRYLSMSKPSKPQPTAKPTAKPKGGSIYDGFSSSYYVAVVTPSTPTGFVHMRWAPSKEQPIFRDYYAGARLVVLYENSAWAQVYDEDNQVTGYMMKQFLNYMEPWEASQAS